MITATDDLQKTLRVTQQCQAHSLESHYGHYVEDAATGQEVCAENLANILEAAGRSVDVFERDVAVYGKRAEVLELKRAMPELDRKRREAHEKQKAAETKLKRVVEELEAEVLEARRVLASVGHDCSVAQRKIDAMAGHTPSWVEEGLSKLQRERFAIRQFIDHESDEAPACLRGHDAYEHRKIAEARIEALNRQAAELQAITARDEPWPLPTEPDLPVPPAVLAAMEAEEAAQASKAKKAAKKKAIKEVPA